MSRWNKIYRTLEDVVGIAFFVFLFFVCGGFAGFMLICEEPRRPVDCIVGTALLLDLAIILGWIVYGMTKTPKSSENTASPEQSAPAAGTAGESAAPGPVEHHVSYLGFFLCFALILMAVSCWLHERKMHDAAEQGDPDAQAILTEHDTEISSASPENREP